jgi:hypothetical protein
MFLGKSGNIKSQESGKRMLQEGRDLRSNDTQKSRHRTENSCSQDLVIMSSKEGDITKSKYKQ